MKGCSRRQLKLKATFKGYKSRSFRLRSESEVKSRAFLSEPLFSLLPSKSLRITSQDSSKYSLRESGVTPYIYSVDVYTWKQLACPLALEGAILAHGGAYFAYSGGNYQVFEPPVPDVSGN